MNLPIRLFGIFVSLAILAACSSEERTVDSTDEEKALPTVYAVNYPLAYFAERIGADSVEVGFPAPADVDPAMWVPEVDTVADYQRADIVLLNGAGYAGWVQRVTLSQSRLVDTSAAFADRLIPVENDVTHSHGPAGDHSHEGTAFTTWLDPGLAIEHARAVSHALSRLLPENETVYRERYEELEQELLSLDEALSALASRMGGQPLLFSHPVYQYFERRYSLNGHSLHWEPGVMPDEGEWRELSGILQSHAAAWMIWEGSPHPEARRRLESLGVQSLVFRPAGNLPETGDFMGVMQENLRVLQQAFPNPSRPVASSGWARRRGQERGEIR